MSETYVLENGRFDAYPIGFSRPKVRPESSLPPCDRCGTTMQPEHAHHKCPECGYILPCCGW